MSSSVLAAVAAIATATAVVMFWLMRAAQRDAEIFRSQVRVANDTAESAVATAGRMRTALRVVAEEIDRAKDDRRVAERVIDEARRTLDAATGSEELADAWDELISRRGGPK